MTPAAQPMSDVNYRPDEIETVLRALECGQAGFVPKAVELIRAKLTALRSERETLREALKPFAKAASKYNDVPGVVRYEDDLELWQNGWRIDFISVGDLRRAAAALTSAKPADKEA